LEIIDGKNLNARQFATNIESIPFFSEKRMVIVKDFLASKKDEEQKLVAKSLKKAGNFNFLIFQETNPPDKRTTLFKTISKLGKVEYFPEMSPDKVLKWFMQKAKEQNIKIGFSNANYLIEQCGINLWTLSNELEKLKLFSGGEEVDRNMMDTICSPSLSSSVFKLTDEIAQKDVKSSLKTIKILRESGEDPLKIFFMIVRHFRILIQVSEMLAMGESHFSISSKLKCKPFIVKKASFQAKNFSFENLKSIYEKFLQIDIDTKTGFIKTYAGDTGEIDLAIEKLIIECCDIV
jgi:DNA polymerase III subunit delta